MRGPALCVCVMGGKQGEATVLRAQSKREARSRIENGGLLVGANSGMASGVMGWIAPHRRTFPIHMPKP